MSGFPTFKAQQALGLFEVEGKTIKEIAKIMGAKESTIERYIRHARQQYKEPKQPAKILCFDIETLPMEVTVWGLYLQKIPVDNILKEWCIVSWAAKWMDKSEILSQVLTPEQAVARDDSMIMNDIWGLLDEADVIIAHNAKRFDIRRLQARFLVHRLPPPMPYRVIDTLKESQKGFATASHKLDYLSKLLTDNEKLKTEYGLWRRCCGYDCDRESQVDSLSFMVEYNRHDVEILEEIYKIIRPWIKSHPNLGVFTDSGQMVCPNCGATEKEYCLGRYTTNANRFKAMRCKNCGTPYRNRLSDIPTKERVHLAVPCAR